MSHLHPHSSPDSFLFINLLALLIWLPMPFASNHAWAWAIMEVWIFVLTGVWLWKWLRSQVSLTPVFIQARWILFLLTIWIIYLLFQITPLPYTWVAQLSPQATYFHSLAFSGPSLPNFITLSVDPHLTAVALLKSISYVLLFGLTLLLINSRHRLRWLAYILVFSGLFQALYGSLMTLSGLEYGFFHHKTVGTGVATGTFVNRNHLAGYLEMCLAVGIGLLIAQLEDTSNNSWRGRLRSWLNWILSSKMRLRLYLVVMVIALVLTRSRMGNTAFFSSLLIAGLLGLTLSQYATRATITLLASLIIIDLLIVGTWFGIDQVKQRLEQTSFATESRDEINIYVLRSYWDDYFLTGSGLGSFYSVFPQYRGADIQDHYDHAHNDYLEIAAETGLIGFILLSSTVIASLAMALVAQYRRHDALCRGMAFSAIMGIIAMLIHSTVDFNLQIPANAATFMIILALAWIVQFLPRHRSSSRLTSS